VLGHVAKGLTTKEISDIMGIGADGVNAHLRGIFSRLNASSRTEAVSIALRNHLLK
jgi:LuxR family maltose regulon positive regulatory protein